MVQSVELKLLKREQLQIYYVTKVYRDHGRFNLFLGSVAFK